MNLASAVFYLDAPVSNAGRLKTRIYEMLNGNEYGVSVELTNKVDSILKDKAYVVTSDAIILNECVSWINLAESIITGNIGSVKCIDLGS